jgi:hypothetical protein
MATTRSLFSEISFGFNFRCRINSPLRKRGQDQGESRGPTGVHGPTTQVTGVLRNPGGLPIMSLTAHDGDPLLEVHPLITITIIRVIKLRALVMRSPNHRSLLRVQLSLDLRSKKWLKLLWCHSLKQVQRKLMVNRLRLANLILKCSKSNGKLLRGLSLLPSLIGRLNFMSSYGAFLTKSGLS